jgi:hypothetical protein
MEFCEMDMTNLPSASSAVTPVSDMSVSIVLITSNRVLVT